MATTYVDAAQAVGEGPVLLVGTRKGAWILSADRGRKEWTASGPLFLGHIAHHIVLDPRDRTTMLLATRTGHLGPTVLRSEDLGRSWKEATRPPAFTTCLLYTSDAADE